MATGLPVVGWKAGNLPHLASHEREGLMAEPGDVDGLAQAISRLAYDEDLRRRLAAGARLRAESLPTWADTAADFFAALRQVAAG
jgi:glycosyltransferase involved in cell wall biosynthesis